MPTIFILEEDPAVRDSVTALVQAFGDKPEPMPTPRPSWQRRKGESAAAFCWIWLIGYVDGVGVVRDRF